MEKEINYYGSGDNYIHAKFGDLRKCYNFTEEFIKEYPRFSEEFGKYFMRKESIFSNPLEITNYIIYFGIPVYAYFNMSDTPGTWEEVQEYLLHEYRGNNNLYRFEKVEDKYYYVDLDNHKIEV